MKDPHTILDRVLVTEKGTRLTASDNKYQFRVAPGANKLEIRRAVEQVFGVHVTQVRTMNRKGKAKRTRSQRPGRTADWKRAIVTLKEGQSITLA
jgi:large subunit ribosomal protein L23